MRKNETGSSSRTLSYNVEKVKSMLKNNQLCQTGCKMSKSGIVVAGNEVRRKSMERLAYAITDHLLRRDVIQKEDYDIYVYGYAVFLEQMCQVIGFILLGIVTKNLLQTALFWEHFT